MKKFIKRWLLRFKGLHICEHKDCLHEAIQCRLDVYDYEGDYHWLKEEYYWYCAEHCQTEGFCYGCGEFWGGCEDFDFGNGLCSNCRDEFDSEFERDREEEMESWYEEVF